VETFRRGDLLLENDENANAEEYFRFAWLKGKSLVKNIDDLNKRRASDMLRKYQEERLELERQRIVQAEQKKLIQEKAEASSEKSKIEKGKVLKEKPLYHTVKRGETLPQISAQVDVYGDYRLWPLLYRANRDQISDPRHIWPGQVLRIPRNSTREEMSEARRYSLDKPI
jgi:LysM repeat protein